MSRETPLSEIHRGAGAVMIEQDGWSLPARYTNVDAEVAAARANCAIFELPQIGLVEMVGPDTQRFANGMFTNNIRRLQVGQGNRNGMADDRGRLMAMLDLYRIADERFLAVLEGVTPEWFYERVDRYIIMDDVELEHRSGALTVLSLQGPGAEALLQQMGAPIPEQQIGALHEGWIARKDRTGLGGFDLLVPTGTLSRAWEVLLKLGAVPAGLEALERLRVAGGRPRWPVDMTDRSFAHELRLSGEICAFDKGCYVGQEVINRMDTMGKLTKKLCGLLLDGVAPPVGAEVQLDGQSVGEVSSSTLDGSRGLGLAVLRKVAWDAEALKIVADGFAAEARISELPFNAA